MAVTWHHMCNGVMSRAPKTALGVYGIDGIFGFLERRHRAPAFIWRVSRAYGRRERRAL